MLSLRFEEEIKSFIDKQKMKEFSTTKMILQEILSGLLKVEKKRWPLEIWKLEKKNPMTKGKFSGKVVDQTHL